MRFTRQQIFFSAVAFLAVGSIALAIYSCISITKLTLPMPTWLPALNIAFTGISLFGLTVAPVVRDYLRYKKIPLPVTITILRNVSSMVASAILVLSLIYGEPSDLKSCASDSQWQRLFLTKNEIAVRSIQTALRCCGYNSMRDRAWPFQKKGVEPQTCELTQGYYIACGKLWKQEQQLAATLNAVATVVNWVLVIVATLYGPRGVPDSRSKKTRQQNTTHSSEQQRLLRGSNGNTVGERYTDDEEIEPEVEPEVGNGSASKWNPEARGFEPGSGSRV